MIRKLLKIIIPESWAIRAIAKGLYMLTVLHISPRSVHKFSNDGRLPRNHERVPFTENPLDDFIICQDQETAFLDIERAHIIIRGSSFDESLIEHLEGVVFLLNWHKKITRRNNYYYTSGDQNDVCMFVKKGLFPILYVQNIILDKNGREIKPKIRQAVKEIFNDPKNRHIKIKTRHNNSMPDFGSSVVVIAPLARISGALEIHGWDHYLTTNPTLKGYWGRLADLLFKGPRYKELPYSTIIRAIYNFHYGWRFSMLPNVINHGYTANFLSPNTAVGQRLYSKLNKVFYTKN